MKRPFEILAAGLVLGELTVHAGASGGCATFMAALVASACFLYPYFQDSFLDFPDCGSTVYRWIFLRHVAIYLMQVLKKHRVRLLLLLMGFLSGVFCLEKAMKPLPEEEKWDAMICSRQRGSVIELSCRADDISPAREGRCLVRSGVLLITIPAETEILAEDGSFCEGQALSVGNQFTVRGRLSRIEGATNPGEFDFAAYYRAKGITHRFQAKQVIVTGRKTDWLRAPLFQLRSAGIRIFSELCEETDAGFLRAVLFGDRSGLQEDFYDLYRRNGIAHLLAISGLHTALIGLSLYRLLRKAGAGYGCSGAIAGCFLIGYGMLTGAGTGVSRAVLMLLLAFLASALGRSYDLRSAACIAVVAVLLTAPLELFQCGFQLSFAAVLSIGGPGAEIWREVRQRRARINAQKSRTDVKLWSAGGKLFARCLDVALQSLFMSAVVTLGTLPIIAYWFFAVPTYSVLLNLLVIPLMGYLLGAGIAALGCGAIARMPLCSGGMAGVQGLLHFLALTAVGIVHRLLQFYSFLCAAAERLPRHRILLGRPELWQIFLYYIILFLCYLIFKKEENHSVFSKYGVLLKCGILSNCGILSRRGILPLFLMSAAIAALQPIRSRAPIVWILNIGQGDSIVIEQRNSCVLIDGGSTSRPGNGKEVLRPFLESRALGHVEAVFITHSDIDHTNGVEYLLSEVPDIRIDRVILNAAAERDDAHYSKLKQEALGRARRFAGKKNVRDTELLYMGAGDRIGRFSCLWPLKGEVNENVNEQSLILLLSWGETRCLFTGDAGQESEERLLEMLETMPEWRRTLSEIYLLKVGHHGSKGASSAEFLKLLQPELAVLSYGKHNRYGHPHADTVQRLREAGAEIYATAEEGAVKLVLDKKGKRKK